MSQREEILYLLQIAQQLDRPDDMLIYARQLAQLGEDLNYSERKLLVAAYKSAITSAQTTVTFLKDIQPREDMKSQQPGGNPRLYENLLNYKAKLEQDIITYCKSFLQLLETNLIPNAQTTEANIFYLCKKADFTRYWIECLPDQQRDELAGTAHQDYDDAYKQAKKELKPNHPTRLATALNYSDIHEAVAVCKEGFDHGVNDLEFLEDDNYKTSTDLLIILRDNLQDWNKKLEMLEQEEKMEQQ